MIKIMQETKYDCFRACIASLLECKLELIPNFMDDGWENFIDNWKQWEKDKPFQLLDVDLNAYALAMASGMTMIAVGKSPRGDFDHAVIKRSGKVVHDPHPDQIGIEGKVKFYSLFFPKDPAIPFCPICLSTMVKLKIECVDGSGWMFGWLCECNEGTRSKEKR